MMGRSGYLTTPRFVRVARTNPFQSDVNLITDYTSLEQLLWKAESLFIQFIYAFGAFLPFVRVHVRLAKPQAAGPEVDRSRVEIPFEQRISSWVSQH